MRNGEIDFFFFSISPFTIYQFGEMKKITKNLFEITKFRISQAKNGKILEMKIEISYQGGIQKSILREIPSPNILKVIILFCMQKL